MRPTRRRADALREKAGAGPLGQGRTLTCSLMAEEGELGSHEGLDGEGGRGRCRLGPVSRSGARAALEVRSASWEMSAGAGCPIVPAKALWALGGDGGTVRSGRQEAAGPSCLGWESLRLEQGRAGRGLCG